MKADKFRDQEPHFSVTESDLSVAAKFEMVYQLLNPDPTMDEDGEITQHEPLITVNQARMLLGLPPLEGCE